MPLQKIKKRDESIAQFEPEKITSAIKRAMTAVMGRANELHLDELTQAVLKNIEFRYDGHRIPYIEGVQDIVERTLMEYRFYDVAKAYILYRERRRHVRERHKEIQQKIYAGSLRVMKRGGELEQFDRDKLRRFFDYAWKGYEGVIDGEELIRQTEISVYDGIKTSEIAKLAVMTTKSFIEKDPLYLEVTNKLFLQNLYKEATNGKYVSETLLDCYKKAFAQNIKRGVEIERLSPSMLNFDLEKLADSLDISRDSMLTYRGLQTLYDRYFLYDREYDRHLETPQMFWMRVAMGLALNETEKEKWTIEFYDALSSLRFVSSTPTLFHAGTPHPQLSSCYLTTIEDSLEHIFKCVGDNAQLSKWSGGLGNDWSNIRATGAMIKGTNVESQGVIPFLKIANDTTVAINRSGKRRGATCAYLETWHLDIQDFLDLRRNTGDERRRTHDMNTANWIPDLFMKRVINDEEWTLFSPNETPDLHHAYGKIFEEKYKAYEEKASEGKILLFKKVQAKDLWKKMITRLFETGHPWITFKDPCNIRSPQDHAGVIHSSNLCTEITLNTSREETAVCNLGSLNLARHIQNGALDNALIEKTTATAMRMLDNVVDLNFYPTDEASHSNMKHRPVGLGIMGFQDALYLLDINFASEAMVEFADESMETISYYAILVSSMLAKERGRYDSYKGSKWDRGILPMDTIDLLEKERGVPVEVSRRSKRDWTPVREAIKKYGMRNSNCLAIAPTATISNICGAFPSIEPIYQNLYVKSNMSGEFTVANPYLIEDMKAIGLWNQAMLDDMKWSDGNIQKIKAIPQSLKQKYKEAFEIEPEYLIKAAAARGKWVDQSQSLNIFLNTTSGKRISEVYIYAWKTGLKTTYYLRTLAASSIEKSTVDINREKYASVDSSALRYDETEKEKSSPMIIQPNGSIEINLSEIEPKIAKLPAMQEQLSKAEQTHGQCSVNVNDGTCEACQ